MAHVDLRKLALRLKVIEMLQAYLREKRLQDATAYWRRLIRSN
jgi:hypothetical protein